MEIPLYNIFGDNYIIQCARETGNSNILSNKVEIDDNELRKVLKSAREIAKNMENRAAEIGISNILPLSRNDTSPWNKTLQYYRLSTTVLSEVFEHFERFTDKLTSVKDKVSAPSFVKPEFYEYGRSPGMVERTRKVELQVEPYYLIIAAAGWVLTRLGKAKVNEGKYVGVHVFPSKGSIFHLTQSVKGVVPGIKPETAFGLWIAIKVKKSVAGLFSMMRIYTISDATLRNPTTVNGGFYIDLTKLDEKKKLLNKELETIASNALRINSNMRERYIVLANYIYEYLTGSKRLEDLLYFANRDLIMNLNSKKEDVNELRSISMYVNNDLMKELRDQK
ncbi:MAG: type I-A CRISPR-associated protein CsaX [Caldisphaera sp.]